MACNDITALDPVQGLVDFVNDIKPYHSKVVEVIVEYQHTDLVDVTIEDAIDWRIRLNHPDPSAALVIGSCPVQFAQIWGAMEDQVDYVLDNALPYLSSSEEFNASEGQTVFTLGHDVRLNDVNNISLVAVNGIATTSYTLSTANTVTITSPSIQAGDVVLIKYLSNTSDTNLCHVLTIFGVSRRSNLNQLY